MAQIKIKIFYFIFNFFLEIRRDYSFTLSMKNLKDGETSI